MSITVNSSDPDLKKVGLDGQMKSYLVLSKEEREKGFIRPLQTSYRHKACGSVITMNSEIAETFARDPKFYTHTFCTQCKEHIPVSEFIWTESKTVVGS